MIIGVTGPKGQLGQELVKQGCKPIDTDITDVRGLSKALDTLRPDIVINCAAKTKVDWCEYSILEAVRVNAWGVQNLATALTGFQGLIVQLSTDYIFDGTLGPYSEDHPPSPINIYGWSKLGAEIYLNRFGKGQVMIARTTVLFSNSPKSFVGKILTKLARGKPFPVSDELMGSPTYVPWLAQDIIELAKRDYRGVINLAGCKVISRYQFAREVAKVWGYDLELILPSEAGRADSLARRPIYAGLKVGLSLELGLPRRDPIQALQVLHSSLEV